MTNDPNDLTGMFGGMAGGMRAGFLDSVQDRLARGKKILFSDRPGSLESKIQAAADANPGITRGEIEGIVAAHFATANPTRTASFLGGVPPVPPPPGAISSPPPPPPPPPPSFTNRANAGAGGQFSAFGPAFAGIGVTSGGMAMPAPPPPPPPAPSYAQASPYAFPAGMQPQPWANMTAPQGPPDARAMPRPIPMPIGSTHGPNAAQRFVQNFSRDLPHAMIYGGGAGAAAKAAFSQAFPPAAVALAAASAMKGAAKAVVDFGEKIVQANKHLAQYNGQMAIAYARLEMGDFRRNTGLAGRTAASGEALVKAVDRMRDSFQESNVLSTNASNQAGVFTSRISENIGNALAPFAKAMNNAVGSNSTTSLMQQAADVVTWFTTAVLNDFRKHLGLAPLAPAAANVALGPWDDLVLDIINGKVGGPILPAAGQQRAQVGGGGAVARFGRGI